MSQAAKILDVYKRRLATITKQNGFSTNIGEHIYEGWLASAVVDDEDQCFPLFLIQPIQDRRADKSAGGRLRLTVSFQILACERVSSGVSERLMQHLEDMRAVLTDRNNLLRLDGEAVQSLVSDADYQIPEDGYTVAWVSLNVSADYTLTIDRS